jgi:hypothetical protein
MHSLRHDVDAALVDETNHERAALDDVGVSECLLLHTHVVQVRAVRAAEILDDEATILIAKLCVTARHHAVVGPNRALQAAADEDGVGC